MSVSRRSLLKTTGAALLPLAAPRISRAANLRTLRFVPQANLSVLDPVWTTAAVTITHGYCVFDTLYGVDGKLQPHPQMAAGATVSDDGRTWLVTLRDGLKFHDGTPVRAIDRLEWTVMPDPATAAAALQRGEIDWWEQALPDLIPLLEKSPDIRLQQQDPYGFIAVARFNASQPPFDNAKLREVVLSVIDQNEYMAAIMGSDQASYRTCYAMFPCGMPGVKELGTAVMKAPHDLAKARQAVRAAGYNGEKVAIINPTDFPVIGPHGQVTAELLKSIGFDVDLQEMDWGSVLQRRLSTKPADAGGWSIYHTNWPSVSIANPALNTTMRGDGKWSGGYTDAPTEDLTEQWLAASDPAKQQDVLDAIQMRALERAPTVPLGQFFVKTAFRKNLQGVKNGSVCYFWNVQKT